MKEITAWKCDYCKKHYLNKSSAKRHENKCFYNSNNHACITCGNFCHYSNTVYCPPQLDDWGYGEHDYEEIKVFCRATEKCFEAETMGEKQRFQNHCKIWIPIKCGRDCDNCKLDECIFEEEKQ